MRSPQAAEASAREPGPTGSIRKASSWRGAKQRLIGRERTRPGASSMKNWPGTPGWSPAGAGAARARPADEGTAGGAPAPRRCVDDEVAAPAADEVDARRPRA